MPAPAVGACMLSAVAAGAYDTIYDAMAHMHCLEDEVIYPNSAQAETYETLYREYLLLHDTFGRGVNPVMNTLRDIAKKVKEQ